MIAPHYVASADTASSLSIFKFDNTIHSVIRINNISCNTGIIGNPPFDFFIYLPAKAKSSTSEPAYRLSAISWFIVAAVIIHASLSKCFQYYFLSPCNTAVFPVTCFLFCVIHTAAPFMVSLQMYCQHSHLQRLSSAFHKTDAKFARSQLDVSTLCRHGDVPSNLPTICFFKNRDNILFETAFRSIYVYIDRRRFNVDTRINSMERTAPRHCKFALFLSLMLQLLLRMSGDDPRCVCNWQPLTAPSAVASTCFFTNAVSNPIISPHRSSPGRNCFCHELSSFLYPQPHFEVH